MPFESREFAFDPDWLERCGNDALNLASYLGNRIDFIVQWLGSATIGSLQKRKGLIETRPVPEHTQHNPIGSWLKQKRVS